MRLLIAIVLAFGLCEYAQAEGIKQNGIFETAMAECQLLGQDALAIQAIRYEINTITIDELITSLDILIQQENDEGSKHQPLFLHRIRVVAQWVFYHYPPDFAENLVGQTYTIECQQKTAQQLAKKFPKLYGDGTRNSQKRDAWQSNHDTEISF